MDLPTRRLGRTGLVVPAFGFGGIPIGREDIEDAPAADVIRRAIEGGMTLIDTFSGYGRSEARIGMAIRGRRQRVTIVTKAFVSLGAEGFVEMVEGSLKTMGIECIDVLLIKNVDSAAGVQRAAEHAETLAKLRRQGKARFGGLSSHSPEHARAAIEAGFIDVAEVPWNYANPSFEAVLDLAADQDVGILAMKPLGGGRLFGDLPQEGAPESLDTLIDALSFAVSHRAGAVAIPGIGSEAELDRYLEAAPRVRPLTDDQKQRLTVAAMDFGDDFCRACGYCRSVCPAGLPIDEILPLLDRFKHVRTDHTFQSELKRRFAALKLDGAACRECRKCVEECPFDLPIPERLKEALEALA